MLTVAPLQCILDMISTSKVMCNRFRGGKLVEGDTRHRIDSIFDAQCQLKLISEMITEYDLEIAMNISHVDGVLNIPPPEGYLYISITPLEQLRVSLKRCACLLHHITQKNEKDAIDHLWIACLQGIIAYKSSWYKLFDILEDSTPSLHKMVAVFSRVRACLRITNDHIAQLESLHRKLYQNTILDTLHLPEDITFEVRKYLHY